jgi:hypothetical protein
VDPLCEEMDDPANCQAWHAAIDAHRERIKAVPVHTSEHPYCLMSDCPCHDHAQEEPTSDEEMEQIMSEPSPLEVEVEENYHRPLRVSAHFQGMMDSLLIEHD